MKEQVIVLGVSKFDFKNEDGQALSGTQVHYTTTETKDEENYKGFAVTKATIPLEKFKMFENLEFPILANAHLELDLTSKRQIKITDFEILDKKLSLKV